MKAPLFGIDHNPAINTEGFGLICVDNTEKALSGLAHLVWQAKKQAKINFKKVGLK